MKSYKLLITLIFVLLISCTSETLPFKAQNIDKITDNKEFIKIMLQLSINQIPNGMSGFLIKPSFIGQPYLSLTVIKELSLSDECIAISDCVGVAYATVHDTIEESKIMYRIYPREQSLNLNCTWIETYDMNFPAMNNALIKQIEGQTQKLVDTCFADMK